MGNPQLNGFLRFFPHILAVVMGEVTKLITCLILVFIEEGRNAEKFGRALRKTIIDNKLDTLKVCVPSFLYVIQNNLLYVSAQNLDAATNQVFVLYTHGFFLLVLLFWLFIR